MHPNPSPLDRILREQREAAATLPAAGGVLGVSDWFAEEVLLSPAIPPARTRRAKPAIAPIPCPAATSAAE